VRILIAEDDVGIRDLLRDIIERQGHSAATAVDGEEAWSLFRESEPFDVIISDWLMPRMEGPELCRRVREYNAPYSYFILLTALGDQKHHLLGRRSGADDYLAKPFDMDDLHARMVTADRVVTLHRRREALLRFGRQVVTTTQPSVLLTHLLDEALALVGGDVGFASRGAGEAIVHHAASAAPAECATLLEIVRGLGEKAANQHGPLTSESGTATVLALPLLHEGQPLGALAVGRSDAGRPFGREDAETLETMANLCAAGLAALERMRLEGVLLAARTAQHELNNRLGVVMGYAEMLAEYPGLPDGMAEIVDEIVRGSRELAETVDQLRRVTRIRETPRPALTGPTLNLTESVA
jgi:CheY-like chemotaxis protein